MSPPRINAAPNHRYPAAMTRSKVWFSLAISSGLLLILLMVDAAELPDFVAYNEIFEAAEPGGGWELFYVWVNFAFRTAGVEYLDFRAVLLSFSFLSVGLLLHHIRKHYAAPVRKSQIVDVVLLTAVLAVFALEYFVIRIRAGLAIGLFFLALRFAFAQRRRLTVPVAAVLIVLAGLTHAWTTAVLLVLVAVPAAFSWFNWRSRTGRRWYFVVCSLLIYVLLGTVNEVYEIRGEHIFSALNPVRFVMVGIVPLLLALFWKTEYKPSLGGTKFELFPYFFSRLYIVLAIGLIISFFSGLTDRSGEAIVRVVTLSSVPALISVALGGGFLGVPISGYLLLSNCLFFLATIDALPTVGW